ncbi:hypothetical protein ABT369_13385 [Dactylosporangium sp. NPDC000244]|uniref:hypothetical protein n=1 Tax=Dactylosporangium sp. NPDC000244 TaxID=3154365 RepID=UPI003318E224
MTISLDPVEENIDWEVVEEVHHPIAPDAVTFFAELGHRIRKGRNKGELTDAWLRLLQRAELLQ